MTYQREYRGYTLYQNYRATGVAIWWGDQYLDETYDMPAACKLIDEWMNTP